MCTSRGHESVLSGSTMPNRGRRAREAMPVLARRCGRSAMAVPVVCTWEVDQKLFEFLSFCRQITVAALSPRIRYRR